MPSTTLDGWKEKRFTGEKQKNLFLLLTTDSFDKDQVSKKNYINGNTIKGGQHTMPELNVSPYIAHVFVCTNDRKGERKSCADNNSPLVKSKLKGAVEEKGWKGKIRVSTSGCMGLCAKGPNVIIYPQKIWFSGATPENADEIVSALERIVANT